MYVSSQPAIVAPRSPAAPSIQSHAAPSSPASPVMLLPSAWTSVRVWASSASVSGTGSAAAVSRSAATSASTGGARGAAVSSAVPMPGTARTSGASARPIAEAATTTNLTIVKIIRNGSMIPSINPSSRPTTKPAAK